MLVNETVSTFIDELGAKTAVPGGGSASALAGSMAASLAGMAAGLTVGKISYSEHDDEMNEIIQKANDIALLLKALVDEDASAYHHVMAAFRLPKDTDQQKTTRTQTIQETTFKAARVPFETMQQAGASLHLVLAVAKRGNKNCASDAAVAALLAVASVEGAYRNVQINLDSLPSSEKANTLGQDAIRLLDESHELAAQVKQTLYGK